MERLETSDRRRQELEHWLTRVLRPWFEDRIIPVDEDVIVAWCRLVEKARAMRQTFPQPDLFLAATALLHDLCVVTRNITDFVRTDVPVLNPWTDTEPRLPAH
jgi:predicted nucleic acid-binding protein